MGIEFFQDLLKIEFPDSDILERTASEWQFLNFQLEEFEIAVEFNHSLGFGVSIFSKDSHPLDGLFGKPDAFFAAEQAVVDYNKKEIQSRNNQIVS